MTRQFPFLHQGGGCGRSLRVLLTAAALAAGGCVGSESFPHTHYSKDEIQHLYDTHQISQYDYDMMNEQMNDAWTPASPAAADQPFNVIKQ